MASLLAARERMEDVAFSIYEIPDERGLVGFDDGESGFSAREDAAIDGTDLRTREGCSRIDHIVGPRAVFRGNMLEVVDMSAGIDIHIAMLAKQVQ